MQYEENTRINSLFNVNVLISFAITIGVLIDFYNRTSQYFGGLNVGGISRYAYFMLAMTVMSILVLLICGVMKNKGGLFIWLPVFYVLSAFLSTVLSGLYPVQRLPFRFVELFYWVAVMLLAYYSVLSLNTAKFHVAIVALMLPLLSYRNLRNSCC